MEQLQARFRLDLWLVTHVEGDRQLVVAASGAWRDVIRQSYSWSESFCQLMVTGQGPMVAPRLRDIACYAQAAVGELGHVRAYVGVPLYRGDDLFGTLCGFAGAEQANSLADALPVVRHHGRMLSTILSRELDVARRSADAAAAYALVERDALTGLRNRRGWQDALQREDQRCSRYGSSASVLVLDVDQLIAVTGAGGPGASNELRRRIAEELRGICRHSDVIARTGGNELAVLAVETDTAGGEALAARLRMKLHAAGVGAAVAVATRRDSERLARTWQRAQDAVDAR